MLKRYIAQFSRLRGIKKALCVMPFFLLGVTQMLTKQVLLGVLLLFLQLLFTAYMVLFGAESLVNLVTLSVENMPSTFALVYGILTVFALLSFLWLYVLSLRGALSNLELLASGKTPQSARSGLKQLLRRRFYIPLLTVPVLGVLAFTVLPLVFMISIAFTGYAGSGSQFGWNGLKSFGDLILLADQRSTLLRVTLWTLVWAFFATVTCYTGGLFLAMLINKRVVRGKTFWRTLFIITMATPQFVSLLVMNQMFSESGLVNQVLKALNLTENSINFWGDRWLARIMIIVVNMWVGIPYLMVMTAGILQNIPTELYESAHLEGANKWQQFIYITMPYMLFITTPIIITQFVGNINNFNVIYLLTGGKPLGDNMVNAGHTDILITWLYKLTTTSRLYNLSAAIGILIFILTASFSLIIYRRTASYKREGDFA